MNAGSVQKSVFAISSRMEILTFRYPAERRFREKDRQFVHFSPRWKSGYSSKIIFIVSNAKWKCEMFEIKDCEICLNFWLYFYGVEDRINFTRIRITRM